MFFDNQKLFELAKELNTEQFLPDKAFRRDVVVHELVSCVNHMIACCISENVKPLPVLVSRARAFFEDNTGIVSNSDYFSKVYEFIEYLEVEYETRM